MRLRYDDELDKASAWSEWFCRIARLFLDRDAIDIGRRLNWEAWLQMVEQDRRALLEEGDGEDLLGDYRFWRDAEPEFTHAVMGLAAPEAIRHIA